MNYFLITTILLLIILMVTSIALYKLRIKVQKLFADFQEANKKLTEEIGRNNKLKYEFQELADSASHYKNLYNQALELYNITKDKYDECMDDLVFAKAIITGDLSTLVD